MGSKTGSRMSGWFLVPVLIAASWGTLDASTLVKTNDRKFPLDFCPLETRGTALDDFTFTATGPAARITFSINSSGERARRGSSSFWLC